MEEILASIRKIISEDSTEAQPAAPAAAAPQPAPVEAEADVLELTQEIEEVPQPAPPAPQPVQAAAPAPEPERPAPPPQPDEVVFQSAEETPAPAPIHSTEGLVSDRARGAIDDALSGLDFGTPEPHSSTATVAPVDGLSVEAVFDRAVRETFEPVLRAWLQQQATVIVDRMKPAIREWMDEHLPDMIRTAVEAEVARAVRARSAKR
jgi:cell pole-organizing protein PopZ